MVNAVVEADEATITEEKSPLINIYPNPVNQYGQLQVSIKSDVPVSQIRLYDLYGRLHLSQDVIDQQEVYSLDIGETQTGTYLVLVTAGDQTWPHKIIIQ